MKTTHTEPKKRFDLYDDAGEHVGEIEYMEKDGGDIYATHTEVFPGNEGKGYAAMLLDALVEFAQSRGAKIVPVCSYVVSAFKKNPDKYASVIK